MPFDKTLGLLRHVDMSQQLVIESDLSVAFEDLYDAVEMVRDDARALEESLKKIFYGPRTDERSDRRL